MKMKSKKQKTFLRTKENEKNFIISFAERTFFSAKIIEYLNII